MMGKTHLIIGIGSGLGAAVLLNLSVEQAALLTVAAAAGSLLPDVDHPKGMIRQKLGILGLPLNILPHRGPTHSLLAVVLLCTLAFFTYRLQPMFALTHPGLVIGYCSHLIADMLTIEGIPLFYPLNNSYISVLPIRTGGMIERVIALGVTIGAGYLAYLLVK